MQLIEITFYWFQLNRTETCFNYTIQRWYPVANMSRYLSARAYELYAPGECDSSNVSYVLSYSVNFTDDYFSSFREIQSHNCGNDRPVFIACLCSMWILPVSILPNIQLSSSPSRTSAAAAQLCQPSCHSQLGT